jgi:nucleotide-binding universal stress UspA family protein
VYGEALLPDLDGDRLATARDRLADIRPADPAVEVEHRLEEGDPAVVIGDIADRLGCDLIVMGSHGRTGVGRLLMGSVAEHVLRQSARPVLTVKATPPPAGQPSDLAELAVAAGR